MPATIKVYRFEELSAKAQAVLIKKHKFDVHGTDYDWDQFEREQFKEDLEKLGYEVSEVYLNLSYSPGSGASFEADINLEMYIKAHKLYNQYRVLYNERDKFSISIEQHGNYHHSGEMSIDWDSSWSGDWPSDKAQEQCSKLTYEILEEARQLCDNWYQEMKEYDMSSWDEPVVREWLIGQDWRFTVGGERVKDLQDYEDEDEVDGEI